MIKQTNTVQFGLLGDEDILNMSVCVINKSSLTIEHGSVYDPRLGCVQNNQTCETCHTGIWTCTGHFGHINLNVPIILFYKQCVSYMKIFCLECKRILCDPEQFQINNIKGHHQIINYLTELTTCSHCNTPKPSLKVNVNDMIIVAQHKHKTSKAMIEYTPSMIKLIFDNIRDEDVNLLEIDTAMLKPKNLVLTKFPVLPTCCRPRMHTPDNVSDDDLTLMLMEIIKNNNLIETHPEYAACQENHEAYVKAVAVIKSKTLAYCDNSKGKAVHNTNHKPMTGIRERISKKEGHIRQNLMGKRCDRTARTVVGPDPTLKFDEVGIPVEIANVLTIPEYVTKYNIDRLTLLVNSGKVAVIIQAKNNIKKNAHHATILRGTPLCHGDILIRNNNSTSILNCKIPLMASDVIIRDGKNIPIQLPMRQNVKLNIGDKVERYLMDGDPIFLNRQPTLHKNSMQGMRVKIKPGKTMRLNLSITSGFNMDFDGDETNAFSCETYESRAELLYLSNAKYNILSSQSNKSEIVIVQDSLLAAYLMTKTINEMTEADFMNCLLSTNALEKYDYAKRLKRIMEARNEKIYTAQALFGFILPPDFHATYSDPTYLTIKEGIIISGYVDKTILKSSSNSIIRLLALEYNHETVCDFIDNVQFLTNYWLELHPFSVGISDCLIGCKNKVAEINEAIEKYIIEADSVSKTTDINAIRESRVNCALNKAKDVGFTIAHAHASLNKTNNFTSTVLSGSKGDFFNITQITGLLGQQNLNNERPRPTINNNDRTLIHYPYVITDSKRKYESRGFVRSSFIGGLNPLEMFFHSMTGRLGMINTAKGTANSGYIQRCCIKMNEDLVIAYDGTVRDANKRIYQFAYGYHGFDPAKVSYVNSNVQPINIKRLAEKLNTGIPSISLFALNSDVISRIISKCKWTRQIPEEIFNSIWQKHENYLKNQLRSIRLSYDKLEEFEKTVTRVYHTSRITPGECVGIISAQSIGQHQTQANLNTFHKAGHLQSLGVGRFEEIMNMTKNIVKTCTIYFKEKFTCAETLRNKIGYSIVELRLINALKYYEPLEISVFTSKDIKLVYALNPKILYAHRLPPTHICNVINNLYEDCETFYSESEKNGMKLEIVINNNNGDKFSNIYDMKDKLEQTLICGIEGITAMHLDYSDEEYYAVTEGSNLAKLLAHPDIDIKRLYCNHIAEVYECLGLMATRKMIFDDIKKILDGVNDDHIHLIVDKLTISGRPMAATRSTMRHNDDVGPLSKATFEESMDVLIAAAMKTEIDKGTGVSSAIISGKHPRVGTGMIDLKIDHNKFINKEVPDVSYGKFE